MKANLLAASKSLVQIRSMVADNCSQGWRICIEDPLDLSHDVGKVHMYTYIYVYIYMYTYMYSNIPIYIYTYMENLYRGPFRSVS
jgi:hypothetical protein